MTILFGKSDAAEEHIPLPESSDDDDDDSSSELSELEHDMKDQLNDITDSDSDYLLTDPDDEPPEALSFKSAREATLARKKRTIEVIEIDKDEKRRKRKELHDQYMLQKIEKRQKIESKLLPENVIEELNDQPGLETAAYNEKNITLDKKEEKEEEVDAEVVKEEIIEKHGPTLFKCKSLAEEDKIRKNELGSVRTLKDRLLYSGRIRREKSSKDADAKRKKQLVVRGSTSNNFKKTLNEKKNNACYLYVNMHK
ncbi:U3 small nucleolar RNA-associated protein NOL7 [Parasteatoda tepidariorum]|uniref:U3 small nucleolar RNA-associated protein NOL7 n=1 Tax=Parasteatoda tepidariorum TaxID=114398 RepID=UPI001C7255CA|nr:nucleolar protein 7 [Parasteatoda tepidariorum]